MGKRENLFYSLRKYIVESCKHALGPPSPQKSIFAKERPNQVKLGEYVDAIMKRV